MSTPEKKIIPARKPAAPKTKAVSASKTRQTSAKPLLHAKPKAEKTGQFTVSKRIHLIAKPEVVWDALTNPEKTKKYFFNCKVFSDWKAGSAIVWKGTVFLFKKIEFHGKIVQIEPEKLLKYTLKNEHSSSTSTVTEKLIATRRGTMLFVYDHVGDGEGAAERFERSEKGWTKVLNGLKKLVER